MTRKVWEVNTMRKMTVIVALAVLLMPFQARAADTGPVSEVFACTLKDGKDWKDFERINAKFSDILKKIGGAASNFDAFVWLPYRGSVDFTYLWAGYYDNFQALADNWQAITDAGMDEEIDALWGELETCKSGLTTVELIYDSPDYPAQVRDPESKSMLESFRCTLQPGKSLDDVRSAVNIWQKHAQTLGLPFDVRLRTPIVSGAGMTHSYFVTHGSASAYGANTTAWRTHPDTPSIDAMLAEVQSCQNALWQSRQVISSD
jgi:hypothetical protein